MSATTRREFLQRGSAGVSAAALAGTPVWGKPEGGEPLPTEPTAPAIPPHRAVAVPGVHAYATEHSVAAGEVLRLHVSASVPYELDICRLGPQVDDPAAEEVVHRFGRQEASPQPVHPGSYIYVPSAISGELRQLALELWIRPWKIRGTQCIISQFDRPEKCTYGLFINDKNQLIFYLGDGQNYQDKFHHVADRVALKHQVWHHVVAVWDGRKKSLWLDGQQVGEWPAELVCRAAGALRIGAAAEKGVAVQFLDADIALPAIYGRALDEMTIRQRYRDHGLIVPDKEQLLGCWPLSEEQGEEVADVSVHRRHGRIINHGTWMIGGPGFRANVPRFGEYSPQGDAQRGHGLRLASDDLYDCRWPVRHEWPIPATARSGLYVARFRYRFEGSERIHYLTFVVRRHPRRPAAPILVLAATNTWRAYSSTPFAVPPSERQQVWGTGGIPSAASGAAPLPAFSFYRSHAAGQGTYQLGLRMPWPVASPYVLYGGPTKYSHLVRAEWFLHAWLEQNRYHYDLISDLDLHRHPALLQDYRVVIIVGHNEYWSIPMYEGLERYLRKGGQVINLSGNTIFWRVSFDPSGTIVECRKVDAPGNQMAPERRGEAWHSQDRRRGGMMRECGYPGWKLIGLESLGWNNQGNPKNFGPFIVENPEHFLFRKPVDLRLRRGEAIGAAGPEQVPAANGHEFDVRLSTLAQLQEQPSPMGVAVPPDPPGIRRLANGVIPWKQGGAAFDYFMRPVRPKTDQGGEMIYWERPDGGKVFNAGTIGYAWAMSADPRLQGLLRNVLAHFGVEPAA